MSVSSSNRTSSVCCLLCAVCSSLMGCATSKGLMVVNVPIADVRAQAHTIAQPASHDPLEETQVLYGERIRLLRIQDGWARVEAVEQTEFTHARRWQGYPGWIATSALIPWDAQWKPTIVVTDRWASTWQDIYRQRPSPWRFPLGTRLQAVSMGEQLWKVELLDGSVVWLPYASARSLDELRVLPVQEKRLVILRHASLLLGDAYFWGGRSPQRPDVSTPATGVDCSGLVNLAYRAAGLDIPRDAHEQFLRARPVNTPQPADMIFLSERGNPRRIVHVMLYAGEDAVMEGPGTGLTVRRIMLAERLGQPLDSLAPGRAVDGQTIFFGAYLPSP